MMHVLELLRQSFALWIELSISEWFQP